jgi:hypothetical protein
MYKLERLTEAEYYYDDDILVLMPADKTELKYESSFDCGQLIIDLSEKNSIMELIMLDASQCFATERAKIDENKDKFSVTYAVDAAGLNTLTIKIENVGSAELVFGKWKKEEWDEIVKNDADNPHQLIGDTKRIKHGN